MEKRETPIHFAFISGLLSDFYRENEEHKKISSKLDASARLLWLEKSHVRQTKQDGGLVGRCECTSCYRPTVVTVYIQLYTRYADRLETKQLQASFTGRGNCSHEMLSRSSAIRLT
ncbi:hypothetical protein OUZ56_015524 [Daphnia magna]|uniref:Uncharacterized protein n=1 Tax=Daphnia magna TaxID=35525 RepID=A0ABR0AN45_9CRUS|nr:hypothetical protein OUZ56_015524 [Daphnia magna]